MTERLIDDGFLPSAFEMPKIEPKRRTLGHEVKLVLGGLLHPDKQIVKEARQAIKRGRGR